MILQIDPNHRIKFFSSTEGIRNDASRGVNLSQGLLDYCSDKEVMEVGGFFIGAICLIATNVYYLVITCTN